MRVRIARETSNTSRHRTLIRLRHLLPGGEGIERFASDTAIQ